VTRPRDARRRTAPLRRPEPTSWHRRYANLGIGTALAAHVLATAVELNKKAACRAVVVTALNARARAWWERLGFHPFEPDDPDRLDLRLLTSEIEAMFKRRDSKWSKNRAMEAPTRVTSCPRKPGSPVRSGCSRTGVALVDVFVS
jgi:hypothetical protein